MSRTYLSLLIGFVAIFFSTMGCGTAAADAGDWKLPDGHFVPAKMPPVIIAPRGGIPANTHYTVAHPQVPYEFPVVVQGGAWPFLYELVEGPEGISLGGRYGQEAYGILRWHAPSGGPHTVRVRVTDQDMTVVERQWTLSVDESSFIFLDINADGGGNGAIDSPYNAFIQAQDAGAAGDKVIIMREGKYVLTDESARYAQWGSRLIDFRVGRRWIGFPGEDVVIDVPRHRTIWSANDGCQVNIRWVNPWSETKNFNEEQGTSRNSLCIISGDGARWPETSFLAYRNRYEDYLKADKIGGSNFAIFFTSTTHGRSEIGNFAITHNKAHNFALGFNNFYYTAYGVFEFNEHTHDRGWPEPGRGGFFLKVGNHHYTLRRNRHYTESTISRGENLYDGNMTAAGIPAGHFEVSWNYITVGGPNVLHRGQSSSRHTQGPVWAYRNTYEGGRIYEFSDRAAGGVYENNVILSNNGFVVTQNPNTDHSRQTANYATNVKVIDEHGKLVGPYREELLGHHGWEVDGGDQ